MSKAILVLVVPQVCGHHDRVAKIRGGPPRWNFNRGMYICVTGPLGGGECARAACSCAGSSFSSLSWPGQSRNGDGPIREPGARTEKGRDTVPRGPSGPGPFPRKSAPSIRCPLCWPPRAADCTSIFTGTWGSGGLSPTVLHRGTRGTRTEKRGSLTFPCQLKLLQMATSPRGDRSIRRRRLRWMTPVTRHSVCVEAAAAASARRRRAPSRTAP